MGPELSSGVHSEGKFKDELVAIGDVTGSALDEVGLGVTGSGLDGGKFQPGRILRLTGHATFRAGIAGDDGLPALR